MDTQDIKVSANRQKKIETVAKLNEKLATAKAVVFTNYQGLTHKQLEGLKKAIKPMQAEYVVAKNSLVLRAMTENKIKVDDEKNFEGPTGTLLIYDDIAGPLKALAKLIKELNIPSVKFGVMDGANLTSEQVLKISALPSKETLLIQVVVGLKSPIYGLHRALNWNLQKLVMTLSAVTSTKPAIKADTPVTPEPVAEPAVTTETPAEPVVVASEPEPETILAETTEEKKAEETVSEQAQTKNTTEVNEGGEN
jgi:large subunit ribosomal protein L10